MFWFPIEQYEKTYEFLTAGCGFEVNRKPLIWLKDKGLIPNPDYDARHVYETAFFGRRGDARIIRSKHDGHYYPATFERHQHEKPLEVLLHFFEMVVNKHTVLFDPTCGGGNSLIAADKLGAAHVSGFEINRGFAIDAQRALAKSRGIVASIDLVGLGLLDGAE